MRKKREQIRQLVGAEIMINLMYTMMLIGLMYTMMPYTMRHLRHAVETLTRTIPFTMEPPIKTRKP
jgi:hypothetical protein